MFETVQSTMIFGIVIFGLFVLGIADRKRLGIVPLLLGSIFAAGFIASLIDGSFRFWWLLAAMALLGYSFGLRRFSDWFFEPNLLDEDPPFSTPHDPSTSDLESEQSSSWPDPTPEIKEPTPVPFPRGASQNLPIQMRILYKFEQMEQIIHLSLSPDEQLLLGQTLDGDVTVWRLDDGVKMAHWPQASEVPPCLGLDSNGYFAVTALGSKISIRRVTGEMEKLVTLDADHRVGQLLLHSESRALISVKASAGWPTKVWQKSPMIQFWDLARGKRVRNICTYVHTSSGPIYSIKALATLDWSDLALLVNYERNDWDRFILCVYSLNKNRFWRPRRQYELASGYMADVDQWAFSEDGQLLTIAKSEQSKKNILSIHRGNYPHNIFQIFQDLTLSQQALAGCVILPLFGSLMLLSWLLSSDRPRLSRPRRGILAVNTECFTNIECSRSLW